MYAQDSLDLLKTSGIDFEVNAKRGINVKDFAELLMCSGVVLNEEVMIIILITVTVIVKIILIIIVGIIIIIILLLQLYWL